MARYSVATTKDNLSSLIDKALAGEEVIITRHGKPTASLHAVKAKTELEPANGEWMERIAKLRATMPAHGISGSELVRQMRDEGAH